MHYAPCLCTLCTFDLTIEDKDCQKTLVQLYYRALLKLFFFSDVGNVKLGGSHVRKKIPSLFYLPEKVLKNFICLF